MKETGYKIMFGVIKKMFIVLLTSLVNASSDTKYVSLSNQKCKVNLVLLIYILMNTVKNYTTIHYQLIWINVSEFVILSITHLIKYVVQIKQKI